MRLQPGSDHLGISTFDKIDRPTRLKVHKDRGVGLTTTKRQVAGWKRASSHNPQHAGRHGSDGQFLSLETQESIGANGQTLGGSESGSGLTSGDLDDLEQMPTDLAGASRISGQVLTAVFDER